MATTSPPKFPAPTQASVEPAQLLDKIQMASLMGLSVRTLEELVGNGQLPKGVRVGRRLFWAVQVVEAWRQRTFSHQLYWRP
jgi:predicted DNA-binding transcriptional regulator AlpA